MIKLIVALGNPGPQYELSRHNFGWLVADRVVDKLRSPAKKTTPSYVIYEGTNRRAKVFLCKPTTYMNLSGIAVDTLLRKIDVELDEMAVVYDDIDLQLGTVKLRQGGGDGGHKGIRSIIQETGQANFYRLRLGIQPEQRPQDTADFVLNNFAEHEMETVEEVIKRSTQALIDCVHSSPTLVMNSFNRKSKPAKE